MECIFFFCVGRGGLFQDIRGDVFGCVSDCVLRCLLVTLVSLRPLALCFHYEPPCDVLRRVEEVLLPISHVLIYVWKGVQDDSW